MNDEFPVDVPFTIEEVPIPFGERLTNAIQQFFYMLMMVPVCLVLAPVQFFRILFTKTRVTAVVRNSQILGQSGQTPNGGPMGGGDDEPWKQQHREMYGDDE